MLHLDRFNYLILDAVSQFLEFKMQEELSIRGQDYTQTLSNSISWKQISTNSGRSLDCVMEDYGIKINRGFTAQDAQDRITSGSRAVRAGTSTIGGRRGYLLELQGWFERKLGRTEKQAKKAAAGTLKKHLREGYDSKRSPGGLGFIDYALSFEKTIIGLMEDSDLMTQVFYTEFKKLETDYFKVDLIG